MLGFHLNEEQESFRLAVRGFAEKALAPRVDELEETETFPKDLFRELGRLGYLGVGYPEERSEEHMSELHSHSFISYAVFSFKKKRGDAHGARAWGAGRHDIRHDSRRRVHMRHMERGRAARDRSLADVNYYGAS